MTATFHPAADFRRAGGASSPIGRPSAPPSAPNYAARRVLAVIVSLAVLAAGAIMLGEAVSAVSDLGGRPAAASEVAVASAASTHVAVAGDTLWAIAERYRGDVGRDRYVDALIALNGSSVILVGQAIRLP